MSEKIPFICEDSQMFIPFMGMYLEMKEQKQKEAYAIEKFTPAMQMIYLWILYGEEKEWTQAVISKDVGVTTMTVSRTLDTFVRYGLLEYSIAGQTGRKKTYYCRNKKEYFANGKKYLINPIKKTFYV